MNMQYPILGIPKIIWAPYHILQQFDGYYIALEKPKKNVIPSLGHTTIPLSRYPINTTGFITYLLTSERVMHSLTKT